MVQPTPEIETFISGVICLLSKGGRCAHHWAQGVIFYKKVVELLVGFLFGCFFFDDLMLFFFWMFFLFSILKGFRCFFDVLIFELMIWCWVSMWFFFWKVLSWWFLVIWCWICYDDFPWFWMIFWVDVLTLDFPDVSIWSFLTWWFDVGSFWRFIFPAVSAKTKNPQSIFLVEMKGIGGTTLWWAFARLIWFPWWVDFGVQNRFTLIHFDLILGYFPREKIPTANWVISRFPQGKKNKNRPFEPRYLFHNITSNTWKKLDPLDVKIAVRKEMLQDFEITNNWDLGFYGHEGDVGARCLSHWWGSLGGKKINNTFFFREKWQKNRTRIHTCAINKRIIIRCSIPQKHVRILFMYI